MLDTIQDTGRYGYQHLGVNPSGAMDRFSAQLANALLGKALSAPVIEMHYPAPQILFRQPCIIVVTGADFSPMINGKPFAVHQPIVAGADTVLSFKGKVKGARCYLALQNNLVLEPWLNSYSTNLKAGAGGYKGRKLEKDDEINFESTGLSTTEDVVLLPWSYHGPETLQNEIEFITGNEWNWLATKSQTAFLNDVFTITLAADRMGYRLKGDVLEQKHNEQLVSSAVSFGTIQLLPNGQLIVLMADHQTTGGYPRIAHAVSADLPKLAQMNPGAQLKFTMITANDAERRLVKQQEYLQRLQNTCNVKIKPPYPPTGGMANTQKRLL